MGDEERDLTRHLRVVVVPRAKPFIGRTAVDKECPPIQRSPGRKVHGEHVSRMQLGGTAVIAVERQLSHHDRRRDLDRQGRSLPFVECAGVVDRPHRVRDRLPFDRKRPRHPLVGLRIGHRERPRAERRRAAAIAPAAFDLRRRSPRRCGDFGDGRAGIGGVLQCASRGPVVIDALEPGCLRQDSDADEPRRPRRAPPPRISSLRFRPRYDPPPSPATAGPRRRCRGSGVSRAGMSIT